MNLRMLLPLFAVVISACGGSSASATAPTPTATPAGTAPTLQGSFTTSLALEDFDTDQCNNAGSWTLTISGTRFNLNQAPLTGCHPRVTSVAGDAFGNDDQIQFTEDSNNGCARTDTYRWAPAGDQVRFTMVADSCAPRIIILTKNPWSRR